MHYPGSPSDPAVFDVDGAMTVPEFCEWARVGRTMVYSEVKAGRLILRKAGAKSLILRSDGKAWLHSLPTVTAIEELDRKPRRSTSDVADEPTANAVSRQAADLETETA